VQDRGDFDVRETVDSDGRTRLVLLGELDHATTDGLLQRLEQLKERGTPVRIDLSQLGFVDSSGIRSLLVSLRDARRDGWDLEVDPTLSWQVERVVKVLGIDSFFWPDGDAPAEGAP
jgi:anti-sigma B factor antagonist